MTNSFSAYYPTYQGDQERPLVSTATLAAFTPPGQSSKTATYTFNYGPYHDISSPCSDTTRGAYDANNQPIDQTTQALCLSSITLPDSTAYGMTYTEAEIDQTGSHAGYRAGPEASLCIGIGSSCRLTVTRPNRDLAAASLTIDLARRTGTVDTLPPAC